MRNDFFADRRDAGQKLADKLLSYRKHPETVVLGLARGGVVVAHAVAQALHLPLEVLCPRKIGAPFNPELAVGAVTEEGTIFLNERLVEMLGLSPSALAPIVLRCEQEAKRQVTLYRQGKPTHDLSHKLVIIVDDGLATGATMRAAVAQVRQAKAKKILLAVPVAPPDTWHALRQLVDEGIVLLLPPDFEAVGAYYLDFAATSDEEVLSCLSYEASEGE